MFDFDVLASGVRSGRRWRHGWLSDKTRPALLVSTGTEIILFLFLFLVGVLVPKLMLVEVLAEFHSAIINRYSVARKINWDETAFALSPIESNPVNSSSDRKMWSWTQSTTRFFWSVVSTRCWRRISDTCRATWVWWNFFTKWVWTEL